MRIGSGDIAPRQAAYAVQHDGTSRQAIQQWESPTTQHRIRGLARPIGYPTSANQRRPNGRRLAFPARFPHSDAARQRRAGSPLPKHTEHRRRRTARRTECAPAVEGNRGRKPSSTADFAAPSRGHCSRQLRRSTAATGRTPRPARAGPRLRESYSRKHRSIEQLEETEGTHKPTQRDAADARPWFRQTPSSRRSSIVAQRTGRQQLPRLPRRAAVDTARQPRSTPFDRTGRPPPTAGNATGDETRPPFRYVGGDQRFEIISSASSGLADRSPTIDCRSRAAVRPCPSPNERAPFKACDI